MGKFYKKGLLPSSIAKNSVALMAVKIFMPLSYFAIAVSVARLLGTKDFGVFSIVMGYYGVFRIISSFGIESFLIREIPRDETKASFYLGNAYFLGAATSVISIFLMNLALYGRIFARYPGSGLHTLTFAFTCLAHKICRVNFRGVPQELVHVFYCLCKGGF